jgi:hypothetical protein
MTFNKAASLDLAALVKFFWYEISFPEIPYSLGVILENIKIRTTRSDFKIPANSDEVIPTEEINFKVVAIDNFL